MVFPPSQSRDIKVCICAVTQVWTEMLKDDMKKNGSGRVEFTRKDYAANKNVCSHF